MVNWEDQTFEQAITQIHKEKEQQRYYQTLRNKLTGENVYGLFCVWCNAFNKGQGKNDNTVFKKFLDEQNVELTFWQKKHLSENHFGYEYEWDHKLCKWKIRKKSV